MMQIWRPCTPPPEELGAGSSPLHVDFLISHYQKRGLVISCGCDFMFFPLFSLRHIRGLAGAHDPFTSACFWVPSLSAHLRFFSFYCFSVVACSVLYLFS